LKRKKNEITNLFFPLSIFVVIFLFHNDLILIFIIFCTNVLEEGEREGGNKKQQKKTGKKINEHTRFNEKNEYFVFFTSHGLSDL
jgi:hypothetical protein